jgi:glycosyltransferase involved in cell wall biosynthesis
VAGDGVLVLGRAIHPPWNEGTRVMAGDVLRLAARVRPAHAISLTEPAFMHEHDPAVPVAHVRSPGGGRLSEYTGLAGLARRALRETRGGGYGVAHLIGVPLAVAPVLRRRGLKVVVHVTLTRHAYQGRVDRLRATGANAVYGRFVDAWACAAEPIRADLRAQGIPARKLHVVAPGIDLAHFTPGDRAAARAKLGLPDEGFTLVYMGTVSPLRFPAADIAAALREAGAGVPDLTLVVLAPVRSHAYNVTWMEENVKRQLADAGVRSDVRLADVDVADKPHVYRAADAVLLPFAAPVAVEPPLTLIEAMACGAIPLAAPYANRSAIVRDGENGFAYSTPQELAGALTRLAAMRADRRDALGRHARTTVESRFSSATTLTALEEVWSELDV